MIARIIEALNIKVPPLILGADLLDFT